jgi:hypothetical protein
MASWCPSRLHFRSILVALIPEFDDLVFDLAKRGYYIA